MRRVLVTGASGFVGRHAIPSLEKGLDPGDIVIPAGLRHGPSRPGTVHFDILDRDATLAAIRDVQPTHLLHLAAATSVHQSASAPAETWRVNVLGSLNVAEAVAHHAPGCDVLFVSSGEVYGAAFRAGSALDETALPQPMNPYARSKLAGEMMTADVLPRDTRLIVLRPMNHTGAGQDERFVLPSFASQIARIESGRAPPLLETGDLSAARDFSDVNDVVAAYLAAIRHSGRLPARCVFNVSSGVPRRIGDILGELRGLAVRSFESRVAADRLRASDIPVAYASSAAIRSALGWAPVTPWRSTLHSIMDDARAREASATPIPP